MRVLFTASPALGHMFPMIPLAWAYRAQGHDVLVATAGPGLDVLAIAGLTAVFMTAGALVFDYRERTR